MDPSNEKRKIKKHEHLKFYLVEIENWQRYWTNRIHLGKFLQELTQKRQIEKQ